MGPSLLFSSLVLFLGGIRAQTLPYPLIFVHQQPHAVYTLTEPVNPKPPASASMRQDGVQQPIDEQNSFQFHSQDATGRSVFGFQLPDQVRIEARDADGTVKGTYSYLDPEGKAVKVQYWDDGHGFHAASNDLPQHIPEQVDFTPEVKRARDQHLALYNQVLSRLPPLPASVPQSVDETPNNNKDDAEYDYSDNDNDVVVVEGVDSPPPPQQQDSTLTKYPKLPLYQPEDSGLQHDIESDSVIVDNPEIARKSDRSSKGFFYSIQFKNIPPSNLMPKMLSPSVGSVAPVQLVYAPQTVQHPQYVLTPLSTLLSAMEPPLSLRHLVTRALSESIIKEQDGKLENQEITSQGVGSDMSSVELTISQKAAAKGGIPVSAIHDTQVSPAQRANIKNHQILPVITDIQ